MSLSTQTRVGSCGLTIRFRAHQHVTLKIYARNENIENEFGIYEHLMKVKSKSRHPGYEYVRTALNTFVIPRPGGDHNCLVQKPMWESWSDLLYRIPSGLFTEDLLKESLKHLFLAMDYLHTECKIVHTGTTRKSSYERETC